MNKILLVEDDILSRMSLAEKLRSYGKVSLAGSGEEARFKIQNNKFDLAIVDLDLDRELEGLKLIPLLKESGSYVVVLSGRESDDVVVKAYQAGCQDYLVKPINPSSFELVIRKFNQNYQSKDIKTGLTHFFNSQDEKFNKIVEVVSHAILSENPILIQGETGTGKTRLAKELSRLMNHGGKFVSINCSEFSESLLESEIFGHAKGAFTGALKDKKGLLEEADGGVLFLDEIATMSLNLQKKLLKAIEEKRFYPVGMERAKSVNFRLISACSENLQEMVEKGLFRKDLYFRIEGFNIALPSLRERKNDLELLLGHFVKLANRRIVFTTDAKNFLINYSWPGNLREMEKVIQVLALKDRGVIEMLDLDFLKNKMLRNQNSNSIDVEKVKMMGLQAYLEEIEAEALKEVYDQNQQKVRKTLGDLKISNNAFYRIMNNIKSKLGEDYARKD